MTDAVLAQLIQVICDYCDAWGRRPTVSEVIVELRGRHSAVRGFGLDGDDSVGGCKRDGIRDTHDGG